MERPRPPSHESPEEQPRDACSPGVSTPDGKITVVRLPPRELDEERFARLMAGERQALAGAIAEALRERPRTPLPARPAAPRLWTALDPYLLPAPPPQAVRVHTACVERVTALGVQLPPHDLQWASADPRTHPRGLTEFYAGRLRVIVNVRSVHRDPASARRDLEHTIYHEMGHACDLSRYARVFTAEQLNGPELRKELQQRAERFVTWVLSTRLPEPPPPWRPDNPRRWYA